MRILLDESLPRTLGTELTGHVVATVPQMGWASKSNGELLRLADGEFDVFITADQNLEYQQNLRRVNIPIVVLVARSNQIDDLRPMIPSVLQVLSQINPGEVIRVDR